VGREKGHKAADCKAEIADDQWASKSLCKYFINKEECPFGDKCTFAHEDPVVA
jgi:hypothetical protein